MQNHCWCSVQGFFNENAAEERTDRRFKVNGLCELNQTWLSGSHVLIEELRRKQTNVRKRALFMQYITISRYSVLKYESLHTVFQRDMLCLHVRRVSQPLWLVIFWFNKTHLDDKLTKQNAQADIFFFFLLVPRIISQPGSFTAAQGLEIQDVCLPRANCVKTTVVTWGL